MRLFDQGLVPLFDSPDANTQVRADLRLGLDAFLGHPDASMSIGSVQIIPLPEIDVTCTFKAIETFTGGMDGTVRTSLAMHRDNHSICYGEFTSDDSKPPVLWGFDAPNIDDTYESLQALARLGHPLATPLQTLASHASVAGQQRISNAPIDQLTAGIRDAAVTGPSYFQTVHERSLGNINDDYLFARVTHTLPMNRYVNIGNLPAQEINAGTHNEIAVCTTSVDGQTSVVLVTAPTAGHEATSHQMNTLPSEFARSVSDLFGYNS